MHLASSSSATNLPDTAAATTLLPAATAAGRPNADTSSSSNTAVVRPMRSQSQSAVITIEQPQQRPQARSASATSYTSEESEESVPDSLEEGRAPLLRRPQSLSDELEQGRSVGSGEEQQQQQEPGKTSRRRIPKERIKTVHALLLLAFAGFLNDLVLSYIHELVPDTDPLPDFAFHHLPYWAQALVVSEYLMIGSFCVMFLIAFSHKYRWVVFRRIFVIGSLLYLGRCVTMFVTQVPKADPNYYCSPKLQPEERTFWAIFSRALSVLFGLGLSINGRHTLCGDYIYSGHTVVHILCYMFICEYSPRRWLPLHWLSFCASSVGVLSLLVSRGHYSIDILVAYWITTRVFWLYHTLADLPALRNDLQGRNKMTKTIWYRLFLYMEGAVQRPVPRKYEIPFTVPPRLLRWWQRRQSGSGGGGGAADPNRDRLIAE